MKTKTMKYNCSLRYITSTWRTLIRLKNTKNWTWGNTKQTWSLLELKKKKEMDTTEQKTDMNITKNEKYKKI